MSGEEANSEYRQLLTNAQEEALIARINHLTDRCMPPTSRIVKKLIGAPPNHSLELVYLKIVFQSWYVCTSYKSLILPEIQREPLAAPYFPPH
jgi:hypothetical protein